jgi:stearoyl-CoA desaturase (delta-9 desaturase)
MKGDPIRSRPAAEQRERPINVGHPERAGSADGSVIWANVAFFSLWTLATVIAVPWYLSTHGITWAEIVAVIGLWVVTGLSITAGYHRLFAHRSYRASWPVRAGFALFGAAAWQSSIISWSAHHRFHHRHVDTDEDPYDATRGFWHAHMGWLLVRGAKHDDLSNVPDLWKDPICRWQHRHWLALAIVVNVAVVLGLGLATGNILGMVVMALLLRVTLLHHATWLINSAAHTWGSQPWSENHTARDNWFLSLLTFGEGYHNYHHTFQADYRNGPLWRNWDPSKWLIWLFERIGLADSLRRVAPEAALRKRFELARQIVNGHLRRLDDDLRQLTQQHLAPVAERCEAALGELKAEYERWRAPSVRQLPIRQRRRLSRGFRSAHRNAKRALRSWLDAVNACPSQLTATAR